MALEDDKEAIGTETETDSNASVNDRSEADIEGLSAEDAEGDDEEQRAADDKGEVDPAKAVVGLRKRIAKLTAQRNQGRAAIQERDALKARVAAYEQRERDAAAQRAAAQRRTPEGLKAEERRQAVRATIDEAYGPGTSDLIESQKAEAVRRQEEYGQRGVDFLRSELQDHDIKADDATLIRWERAVGSELAEDVELLAAYQRPSTQKRAIEVAFQRVRDGLANPAIKQQGGKPLARITRNREAVLGSARGAVEGAPEAEVDLTPPKELKGRALDEYWANVREREWKKLTDAERRA